MYAVVLLVSLVKQSYTRLCCLSLFIQNKVVVAEFVHSLVYGSSRFTDVHEEVFSGRSDAVEAGGLCSLRPDAELIKNQKKSKILWHEKKVRVKLPW